ncbi:MAG TPA: exo-alpha-sialidase [Bacteroidota bacterium]|nr:exo-alpha-sialidase [Bacteroidota bacterium]
MVRSSSLAAVFIPAGFLIVVIGHCGLLHHASAADEPLQQRDAAAVKRTMVIHAAPGMYCAWPSIARAANNDLLVLFTQTEEHLSPDGTILSVRSTDDGTTWQPADTAFSTPLDDRESGMTVLRDGTIVTHFWSTFWTRAAYASLRPLSYKDDVLERWSRHVDGENYLKHRDGQGPWQTVSVDHGKTWSKPVRGNDAVHGGIQLFDGTLLLASYRQDRGCLGVYVSPGPESPYTLAALVRSPDPDSLRFGEPHILQLVSGRVIMMIRAEGNTNDGRNGQGLLWETYSDDNGRSWCPPFPTRLWGHPPHLLQLSDGRVLCTYGYRRPPFGERACTSVDGITWNPDDEIILRDDAPNGDLGYPASVELGSGEILTVYYQPPVPPGTIQQMTPPDPDRRKPALLGTVWSVPPALKRDVPDLGSRREVFIDSAFIERLDNASLRMHEPVPLGVALRYDKPWEGRFSGYATVIRDGALYRLWYRGLPSSSRDSLDRAVTCYAESRDGRTWKKPELGLFASHGTKATNIVLGGEPDFSHNFSPLLDSRPGVPSAERYKAVAGNEKTGLVGFVSPDGIHWRKIRNSPLITEGKFDSQNVVFWWEPESTYVCFLRTWTGEGYTGFRTISRSTSRDFLTWTRPVAMEFGGTPMEHLYTNGTQPYVRAPHIALGLAKRFFPGRPALSGDVARSLVADSAYRAASSDAVLLSTRGGIRYDRTFMEALLRPGTTLQDWVSRDNTPALGVVLSPDGDLLLHRGSHYAQSTAHLAAYRLRLDGFASVHALYGGGEVVTKPFRFKGSALSVNLSTSAAGGLRVEIQDAGGRPIPGFALTDAVELMGDGTDLIVSWKSGSNVSALSGRLVRVRFVMRDADLYAFRFAE